MSDADGHRADPDEVFSLVANETRFDILRAVWDLTKTDASDASATFAAVRAEAGVQDSGQFNYHLQELSPRFVRKTDEGYETTYAGSQLFGEDPLRVETTVEVDGEELRLLLGEDMNVVEYERRSGGAEGTDD